MGVVAAWAGLSEKTGRLTLLRVWRWCVWYLLQDRREAAGELNLLENPAFYTVLFFAVPVAILVWGAGTGVIPGFVTPTPYEF